MIQTHGGRQDNNGADSRDGEDEQRGRSKLAPPLQIPKNRSTGNLAVRTDHHPVDTSRYRFSFDAGAASAAEYEPVPRSAIMTDHDHGLGLSGLRRIRQQHPPQHLPQHPASAFPPSNASSRSPSVGVSLTRSTSMTLMLSNAHATPLPAGPTSPSFSEDLSRFPSESLHSFSFAHQSEEFLHNRQNVLKRSVEFMRDRVGWSGSAGGASQVAALASAQARATGDLETQDMLELLARAQLVGAGNLPHADQAVMAPLTGPPSVSGAANPFDKDFIPRTTSPETVMTPLVSPTSGSFPPGIGPLKAGDAVQTAEARPSLLPVAGAGQDSENSSRTPTNESGTTQKTSPPLSRHPSLKRTLTDTEPISVHHRLMDTMAQPFMIGQPGLPDSMVSPTAPQVLAQFPGAVGPALHGHSTRWVPAAQAIFTTQAKPPWTIIAANDLACLVFGVTKAEVRKMGILEVVQEERRSWLENKLLLGAKADEAEEAAEPTQSQQQQQQSAAATTAGSASTSLLGRRSGITAKLLSKPNSRSSQLTMMVGRRAATVHSGDPSPPKTRNAHHNASGSRGVLLCGDVVPIQKRNGATGSASLWVKEKRVGLIWVLEEIHEDVATVEIDEDGRVQSASGATGPIWGFETLRQPGMDVGQLIPRIPRQGIDPRTGEVDFAEIARMRFFTCPNSNSVSIPCRVEQVRGRTELRVSSFPHMAGIVVVSPEDLAIKSANSVVCGALFGHERPAGMHINALVPDFDKVLGVLTGVEGVHLVDGIVVPEHSFRKASAFLALRESWPSSSIGSSGSSLMHQDGLVARHRDGSELRIDVQMRVVKSEKQTTVAEETVLEGSDEDEDEAESNAEETFSVSTSEMVFALWITYSRHLHATKMHLTAASPSISGSSTPLHQPSPGQTPAHTPMEIMSDSDEPKKELLSSTASLLTRQLKVVAMNAAAKLTGGSVSAKSTTAAASGSGGSANAEKAPVARAVEPVRKKTIADFVILEDMGQGAYGQVKLARHRESNKKVVLKYVTKRRILVDTWTRDRKLGTVPLEIHVLDYLRRPELRHPNIVEMESFFEDDVNYYIEMVPHGLPGIDLFDYIELRSNMEEAQCRSIFVQVARAIQHLHTKALVVHRDIKDENVILDGGDNIKLIDFGSAAYIKSGPFDVFVGTIDYAAPEVLAGKPYGGKEQDVWALGILLYTIIYKENPFYSIDEIIDRDLRVPFTISPESIDLVRCMLNRDVAQRYDINQVLAHPWLLSEG